MIELNKFEKYSGYELLSEKELKKIHESQEEYKITCSCGTKTVLVDADKTICRGCHNYVFKDKETEFKYRLKEKMLK
jgi:hydrogenase maturation factor HypF (carbamoyltransferase family)